MIHIILIRALFPTPYHRTTFLSLLESAGINVQESNITTFAHKDVQVGENTAVIKQILGLRDRMPRHTFVVVAFSTGRAEQHLLGLFQTLCVYDLKMLPPVGVVFEPEWPSFVRMFGLHPNDRYARIPFRPLGGQEMRSLHVLPVLDVYRPDDAITLGVHFGFAEEEPIRSRADETQPIKTALNREVTDLPTLPPPPPSGGTPKR